MPGSESDDARRTAGGGGAGRPARAPLDPEARARLRGRRAGHGLLIAVALVFIGASAAQIIPAVFGWRTGGAAAKEPAPSADPACVSGIRALVIALDRAGGRTWADPETPGLSDRAPEPASATFERALAPEWDQRDAVERACAGSERGREAWAALLRLRGAEEELLGSGRGELAPLRDEVAAHLGVDLR